MESRALPYPSYWSNPQLHETNKAGAQDEQEQEHTISADQFIGKSVQHIYIHCDQHTTMVHDNTQLILTDSVANPHVN